MNRPKAGKLKRSAFTLMSALSFTVLVSTILAGAGTVVMSHYNRSKVEGSYANAIALADAGVNFELAWISRDTTNTSLPHAQTNPYVGSVSGVPGTFSVYVRKWGTNCNGGAWSAPADMCVVATGTVNGISRTVQVRGERKSVFEDYVIYSNVKATFSGGGSGTGSTEIVGNFGSNGPVSFNGSANTTIVKGNADLNGPSASSTDNGTNIRVNPDPYVLPTVSQAAMMAFPAGGLTWLQTNNNNASIRRLAAVDLSWLAEPTVAGITVADVNALTSAGFTAASRTFADPPNTVPSDTSLLDDAASLSSTWRFVTPADTTYGIAAYGVRGKRVYFVPPGDYYFTKFDFKGGNSALVFLTHLGRIRIWVDAPASGSTGDDSLSVPTIFTDTSPAKFRLYYNKCATFNVGGSSRFNGSFYAIRSGCSDGSPNMDFSGNSMIYGSVLTNTLSVTGGSKIVFPNNGGWDIDDPSAWYGFKESWKEVSPNGRPVFSDGTSN